MDKKLAGCIQLFSCLIRLILFKVFPSNVAVFKHYFHSFSIENVDYLNTPPPFPDQGLRLRRLRRPHLPPLLGRVEVSGIESLGSRQNLRSRFWTISASVFKIVQKQQQRKQQQGI
jgi:hypothetical protein